MSKSGSAKAVEKNTSTSERLSALRAKRRHSGMSWSDCEPVKLQEMITAATEFGCLVSFSKTSDGGAVCLFVKEQSEKENFYAANEDELAELIEHIHGAYAE